MRELKRFKSHLRGFQPGVHRRGRSRPRSQTASRRLFRRDF